MTVGLMPDVDEPMIVSAGAAASVADKTAALTSGRSGTLS